MPESVSWIIVARYFQMILVYLRKYILVRFDSLAINLDDG